MALPRTYVQYKKMSGFATTRGQDFEVNLAALLFLRGLNSGLDFELGTNVKGAGALDDIVFRFKTPGEVDWTTLFVQMKHKERSCVSRNTLTSPKGDFSVPKYFKAFLEIEESMTNEIRPPFLDGNFEKCLFVIFTNAAATESLGPERGEYLSQEEEFLWLDSGFIFSFEKEAEILHCLGACDDKGGTFLNRLRFFCDQPTPKTLEVAIKEELQKVDEKIMKGVYLGSIVDCFLRRTKIWWEKSSEVLCNDHDLLLSAILDAASDLTTRECKFSVEFSEAAFIPIRLAVGSKSKIHNIFYSENSFRLSLTKLLGAIGGQSLVLTCKSLLANKDVLMSQCSRSFVKSLIICTHDWNSEDSEKYFEVLTELVNIPVTSVVCKTVLLTENSSSGEERVKQLPDYESLTDEFLFSQLSEKSRELILDKQMNFQGFKVKLSQLLTGSLEGGACDLDKYLDAASVVDILASVDSLPLGPPLTRSVAYYIDRTLEKATVLNASVFHVGNLRGTAVTIRMTLGDPGQAVKSFSRLPRVADDFNKPVLVKKAIQFISSLKVSKHNHHVLDRDIARNLTQEPLSLDRDDVFSGLVFQLGEFFCKCVGLRAGKHDAVTAMFARIPDDVRFLFVSDKTDEADAAKLSNYHQSKHFVLLENDQLRWIRSVGDIELIRPHIDQDKTTTFDPKTLTDVEDRLVVVCAEPGMGKSTLMTRLATNTKEAYPHYFVILVALNDLSHLFAQNKHQDALGFLSAANKIESHLHLSLLKYALEVSGNVVVLFDGYDEIAPKYVKQLHCLISRLKSTKARKMWITSRNSIKLQIENHSSTFSAKLCKFNEDDQKQFLKKYWVKDKTDKTDKRIPDEAKLGAFIDKLLEKTSEAIGDKETNLMGIPLQTRMLAEVYASHVNDSTLSLRLDDNLDLLALLEKFVEIKFNIYVQDRLKLSSDHSSYDDLWTELRAKFFDNHGRAGLILILRKDRSVDVETFVKESSKFFKEIQSGTEKAGFVDDVENENPHFVHRVFAEYFVANWMSMHFTEYVELIKSNLFTPAFAVIRNFFEFILAKGCDLHNAVLKEDLVKVKTLLNDENVNGLLNVSDSGDRTALHLAASRGTSDDRKENDRRRYILNQIIAKTSDFNQVDKVLRLSPLQYADLSETWVAIDKLLPLTDDKQLVKTSADLTNPGMLEEVFVFDLSNLLDFCLVKGLAVEHCTDGSHSLLIRACEKGSLKAASLLIERNAIITYKDETNTKKSALKVASRLGQSQIVKRILSKYAEHYNEVKTCVSNYSAYFGNELQPLYWWNRERAANDENVIDLLSKKHPFDRDVHVNSPMHVAAFCNQPSALRVLLEDTGFQVNMRTSSRKTVLFHGAWGGSLECVKILAETAEELTFPSVRGTTPLMVAAECGHLAVVTYLLTKEPEDTKVDYINSTDIDGNTAIHLAAKTGQTDVIKFLIEQGGDFQGRNRKDQTPIHSAAEHGRPGTVKALLEELKKKRIAETEVVNVGGHVGFTELMCAAFGGCLECVTILVAAGGKMSQLNNNKRTSLMVASTRHHASVVRYLLDAFDATREGMALVDFVNMVDKDGINALHLAARKSVECVSLLVSAGGKLSQEIKGGGTSLIEAASRSDNAPIVRYLLESFDAGKEGMTLRDFVDKKDKNGETVLQLTNTECSNIIKSFLKQNVD